MHTRDAWLLVTDSAHDRTTLQAIKTLTLAAAARCQAAASTATGDVGTYWNDHGNGPGGHAMANVPRLAGDARRRDDGELFRR